MCCWEELLNDSLAPATCTLCPRRCQAARISGERGFCGATDRLRVARVALHHWEEPPISGCQGSGTVFFSNCGLRCVYCQNYQISLDGYGTEISTQRLARAFLELAGQGAHNINLVTATQYSLEVMEAVQVARSMGLKIPVIWNSSGYENVETIMRLADTVDAWLMDFRYCSAALAERYSQASDYPSVAAAALLAAVQQSGPYTLDSSGLMTSGVLVRFLLLPGLLSDTIACVDQVFSLVGNSVCYSLLSQYTPPAGITERYPELAGQVSAWDYDLLIDHVLGLGITDSFMQEEGSSSADFIPAFDLAGVVNQSVQ